MPFSVGTFYKTKIVTSGVQTEFERQAVYVPDAELSDSEDLEDEDDAEIPDIADKDFIPNLDAFEILGTELEDSDCHSDESNEEDVIPTESAEGKAETRWKKSHKVV